MIWLKKWYIKPLISQILKENSLSLASSANLHTSQTMFSFSFQKLAGRRARRARLNNLYRERRGSVNRESSTGNTFWTITLTVRDKRKRRSHCQHCHSLISPHSPTRSLQQESDACGGGVVSLHNMCKLTWASLTNVSIIWISLRTQTYFRSSLLSTGKIILLFFTIMFWTDGEKRFEFKRPLHWIVQRKTGKRHLYWGRRPNHCVDTFEPFFEQIEILCYLEKL